MSQPRRLRARKPACVQTRQRKPSSFGSKIQPLPLGIESADLPLLTILGQVAGGIASHFLHLGAALAATAMLFRLSRGNALALAAIVTTPALALIAGWSLVDWPLIGICAILVLALEDGDAATVSMAIAAGLLTKYTFVPFAILGCGVWGVGRGR